MIACPCAGFPRRQLSANVSPMTSIFPRSLALTFLVLVVTLVARAGEADPAILARARARLGSEAAIEGLKTIHYVGTLTTADPKDSTKQLQAKVEMFFQKPDRQRITATYDKFVETTALDAYEGWTRVQDSTDSSKWRLTLLDPGQIKRLRANTWESLSYFRGIGRIGGRVEDKGPVSVDGVNCQKIAFIHDANIIFYRYFDAASGRLVLTETESGGTHREQGEIVAGGIRFPKTLVTMTKNGDRTQTVTLNYEKVTVNETFPANFFAVPALSRK